MIGLSALSKYRTVLVVAAAAGAAWTVQGWRMGKQLAQQQNSAQAATIRRSYAATQSWVDAAKAAGDTIRMQRAALQAARVANAAMLARVRLAQPTDTAYSCRALPLPDTYLETFRR